MAIDNKKEQEREELHRAIWAIADELRGAVDGWDFKNYVLGTMFYRYISENLTAYVNQGEIDAGNQSFDYAKLSDKEAEEAREGLVEEKGFFILPSELFCNVRNKCGDDKATFIDREGNKKSVKDNLNELLEMIFDNIERSAKGSASEERFAGLFDDFDVNSNKLGSTVAKRNERLVKLLDGIADMNIGTVSNHDIDAFGDAYEYLMTMYASNAGKSGGEFFTPADVSELLTLLGTVGKKKVNKVYDPACGSGSLLLKAEKILGKDSVANGFFGQEINITTYNLCRINMFLHNIGFDKFDIECEDTLTNPQHWDYEPFELIVSNPPYSIKWEGDDNPLLINDPRFSPAGVLAPKSKADYAFIMHSLSWLSSNGTAAIVCYPGIMSRPGSEKKIRQYLVDNNYVDCIIHLPDKLFYGTPTDVCIMVLKKCKPDNSFLFIDATKNYVKGSNNNRLSQEHIEFIVNTYTERKDVSGVAYLAEFDEVKAQGYNIAVETYVKPETIEEKIDIDLLNMQLSSITSEIVELQSKIEEFYDVANANNPVVKLNRILEEKFQGGVLYRSIGNSCKVISPPKKLDKKQYLEEGEYPVVDQGQKFIIGYTDDEEAIVPLDEYVVFGDHTREIKYIDFEFAQGADGLKILKANDDILPRYLYHALINADVPSRGYNRHWSIAKEIKIPIPSKDIQALIVEVLDAYTNINSQMENCIEKRKEQYRFHSNQLFNMKEKK